MSRPTALPLIKALGLILITGALLYGGHAWLNSGQQGAAPASAPTAPEGEQSATTPSPSGPATTPLPGRLEAKDLAQAYASGRHAADARFKGQRMQIQGVIDHIEPGQGQVLLITLGAADGHGGLRAVVDGGAQPLAAQAVAGQSLHLDCLNQGLVMEEPLLSDCRVLP